MPALGNDSKDHCGIISEEARKVDSYFNQVFVGDNTEIDNIAC